MEVSHSGAGTIFGKEATVADTGVSTLMPNGVFIADANGMLMTAEGDSVMTKINGIGSPTVKAGNQATEEPAIS